MNKLIIAGNLGRDAEVRSMPTGTNVISFTVAVTESYTNAAGEKIDNTTWVACSRWVQPGKSTAVAQYLKKGTKVLVVGKASVRAWLNDANEEARASLELRVDELDLMGQAAPANGQTQQPQTQQAQHQPQATYQKPATPDGGATTDDLPF